MLNSYITDHTLFKSVCKGKYLRITDSYYNFDCGDYLISYNFDYSRYDDTIKNRLAAYDDIPDGVALYYFFINRSSHFDFETNTNRFDISDYLQDNYSQLSFNNYDEYKNYFYKTDHHWNHKGSYEGYKKITNLITNEEPISPTCEVNFDTYFYGSSARSSTFTKFKELFTVYEFDIPDHDEYINGSLGKYGNEIMFNDDSNLKNMWLNMYAQYYGSDYAEVIYDFGDVNKENLLILSNSFSNSVNKLIASHFNKTFIIDLRFYEDTFGHKFDYTAYIKVNNIDKVLVIADINYLISSEFNLEEVE